MPPILPLAEDAWLSEASALDERGAQVPLATLWSEGPAVLVFLRHFGCIGCVAQLGELRPRLGEFLQLGCRVALVGCGTPRGLGAMREREELDPRIALLTDPTLESHRRAGMRRSWVGAWGPGAALGLAQAMGRGYRQPGALFVAHPDEGERTQQGGVVVVAPPGRVLYAYASERLGDLPPLSDVLEACLRQAAGGAAARV